MKKSWWIYNILVIVKLGVVYAVSSFFEFPIFWIVATLFIALLPDVISDVVRLGRFDAPLWILLPWSLMFDAVMGAVLIYFFSVSILTALTTLIPVMAMVYMLHIGRKNFLANK